jgi:monofunctional glycosyltransferase
MIKKFLKQVLRIIISLIVLSVLLPLAYRWINPPITLTMLSRTIKDGEPIKKHWVPIEDISPYMVQAAVAAEDNLFLVHNGFDVEAIKRAINHNEKSRRIRGGSTISQQTAKNVFLTQSRTWVRKGLEVYFTFIIEQLWPKERIMEVYLNVIEMGHGIYGAEAASQVYFHKSAKNLTMRQAALITAIYPNPRKRNPANPSGYVSSRATRIEGLMYKVGPVNFDKEKELKEKYKLQKQKIRQQEKKRKSRTTK